MLVLQQIANYPLEYTQMRDIVRPHVRAASVSWQASSTSSMIAHARSLDHANHGERRGL